MAQQKQQKSLAEIDTTMWKYLTAKDSTQWSISKADSEEAYNIYVGEIPTLNKIVRIENRIDKGRITLEKAAPEIYKLLEEVRGKFEKALKLNPFDQNVKSMLVEVYWRLIQYEYREDDFLLCEVFNNLLHTELSREDALYIYNNLGNIYFSYEMWPEALKNFRMAVITIFEGDETQIDSTELFYNIYYRGQCLVKLYDAELALESFERALMIAPSKELYQEVMAFIDFVKWDDGNIPASEQYQKALELEAAKKYSECEKAYLKLLQITKTERAKNEAQLNLSIIQFNNLGKKDEGINRLWGVVQKMPLDSLGTPVDPAAKNYWETYGFMCLELGKNYYDSNKKVALTYFLKTSQIDCSFRASAYLYLAGLTLNDVELCLSYCNKALKIQRLLTKEERKELYNLFYLTLRRKGEFEQALKWYEKYHEI